MLIEYYGHSCFALTSGATKIVIDPYSPEVGYKMPTRGATATLVSHEHFDHNHVGAIVGRTAVVRGAARREEGGVKIRGVLADHDDQGGACRGKVTLFCLEIEGLRVVHLSDLGQLLQSDQLQEIGPADVLFVPVGGGHTIGAAEAHHILQALKPTLAVPMHYRTPFLNKSLFPDCQGLDALRRLIEVKNGPAQMDFTSADAKNPPCVVAMTHLF